jgi:hypothetical protein
MTCRSPLLTIMPKIILSERFYTLIYVGEDKRGRPRPYMMAPKTKYIPIFINTF